MPIYEYRCDTCHKEFEEWQKQVDQGNTPHPCPHCDGQGWRLISHTSFALKGQGWYVTEYGNKKNIQEKADAAPATEGAKASGATASSSAQGATASAVTPPASVDKAPASTSAAPAQGVSNTPSAS